jgi:N utilization substance protein B
MLALQALCLFDAIGERFAEQLGEFLLDSHTHGDLGLEAPPSPATSAFARELAEGAWSKRAQYDELLSQTATDWSVARMPPVDRNILRLGLFELSEHPETPPEVVLNEAIELARLFAGEDSPRFVNAVLDVARRRLGSAVGAAATGNEPPPESASQRAATDDSHQSS